MHCARQPRKPSPSTFSEIAHDPLDHPRHAAGPGSTGPLDSAGGRRRRRDPPPDGPVRQGQELGPGAWLDQGRRRRRVHHQRTRRPDAGGGPEDVERFGLLQHQSARLEGRGDVHRQLQRRRGQAAAAGRRHLRGPGLPDAQRGAAQRERHLHAGRGRHRAAAGATARRAGCAGRRYALPCLGRRALPDAGRRSRRQLQGRRDPARPRRHGHGRTARRQRSGAQRAVRQGPTGGVRLGAAHDVEPPGRPGHGALRQTTNATTCPTPC